MKLMLSFMSCMRCQCLSGGQRRHLLRSWVSSTLLMHVQENYGAKLVGSWSRHDYTTEASKYAQTAIPVRVLLSSARDKSQL